MRIVIVHYTAPPVPGGAERIILQHAKLMSQAGHAVSIVAGRGRRPNLPNVTFHRVALLAATEPAQLGLATQLARGELRPDFERVSHQIEHALDPFLQDAGAVIVHNAFTLHFNLPLTAALGRFAAQDPKPRTVAWTHDIAAVNPLYREELHAGYPWELVSRPQSGVRYVSVSDQRRRELTEIWAAYGSTSPEIEVIPNGIDAATLGRIPAPVRRLLRDAGAEDRDLVMLLPVRITRRKNIELAIGATAALKASGADPLLLVSGPTAPHHPGRSEQYRLELVARAARLGVEDRVVFAAQKLGRPLSPPELAGLFWTADVLLLPSAGEGFGLPILEAGAERLPIVATDLPVFRELAGDDATYFPLSASAETVASLVLQAVDNPLGRLRRRVMREYEWEHLYAGRIEPLLQNIAAQTRERG